MEVLLVPAAIVGSSSGTATTTIIGDFQRWHVSCNIHNRSILDCMSNDTEMFVADKLLGQDDVMVVVVAAATVVTGLDKSSR